VALTHACGHERIVAEQLIGEEDLVAEVEQPERCQEAAVGAKGGGEFTMLVAKLRKRRSVRGKIAVTRGFSLGCGAARALS
jgi:hypothetical protein